MNSTAAVMPSPTLEKTNMLAVTFNIVLTSLRDSAFPWPCVSRDKTDIEIARAANKKPIQEIGAKLGIPSEALLPYGHDKAKVGRTSSKTCRTARTAS
jgi:hypothetical protein